MTFYRMCCIIKADYKLYVRKCTSQEVIIMNKLGEFAGNVLCGIVEAVVEIVFDIVRDFLSGL